MFRTFRTAVAISAFFAASCASPVVQYAEAQHPGCRVTVLDDSGGSVRVAVTCPGADPFERTYRKR
jgi:hypothetical protein